MPQAAVSLHIESMMSAQQRLKSKWKEYMSAFFHLSREMGLLGTGIFSGA